MNEVNPVTNTHLKYTASGTKPNSSLNCFVISFISLGGNLKKLGLKGYTKHHQRFYHSWFHPDYRSIFRCFLRSQKIQKIFYFFVGERRGGRMRVGQKMVFERTVAFENIALRCCHVTG